MCRTGMCRFGIGNWIFLIASAHLFTYVQGLEDSDEGVRLTAEPLDLVVEEGEVAVLGCGARGAGVAWRHREGAAPGREDVVSREDKYRKQLPNGSLVIESMSASLAGRYQCVASGAAGSVVSRIAVVTLAEVPPLLPGPRSILGLAGSPALLPCGVAAPALAVRLAGPGAAPERRVYSAGRLHSPPPVLKLNVTWLKNGSPVRLEAARVSITPSGALELDPLREHDAASYRCRVSLSPHKHRTSEEIELRVSPEPTTEEPPRFIATPRPLTVIEGASVTFDCAAVGNPKPEMIWLNNGVAIDLNDLDSRFYLVGSGSLRVQAARALDAGTYTCRAHSALDSADATTSLHVLTAPRATIPSPVAKARERGDVTLRCDVRGRPPPRVTWLKDGEPLTLNQHDIALVDGSSLRIQGVLRVDAGMFQCLAVSEAGSAQASVRLVVLPPDDVPKLPNTTDIFHSLISESTLDPSQYDSDFVGEVSPAYTAQPDYDYTLTEGLDVERENVTIVSAPRGLRAVIVKHRFVTLSWEPPERKLEEIIGYIVVYRVKGSERERVSRGSASRVEMNVAALQPNTTYQFAARALTASAISPPTQMIEAHTAPEEFSFGPPTDVRVETLGPHSLRVKWRAPAPPAPTSYTVHYTELETSREQVVTATADETGQGAATLGGLRAATAYSVAVAGGGGAAAAPVPARTAALPPAAPPGNVTAEPASPTSILVRWEAPPARTQRGALTGYKVRFRAAGARGKAASLTTPADVRRAELRNLAPHTTYQIRVCAINANGSGPFSEWLTAATAARADEARAPAAPPPLSTRAGRDWISVWWEEPDASGGAARAWTLGWGLGVPDERARTLPSASRHHVIRGLEPNAEYVISLHASNALGAGPPVYATVRTRADDGDDEEEEDVDDEEEEEERPPLIPPVGLKVIMLSGTTAVVYWTDPTLPKGQTATDGRRYVVRWAAAAARPRFFNASDLNCMLDDLKPFTLYEFAVKLIKGGQESAWSMIVSNTTLEAAPASAPRELRASPATPAARAVDLAWAPPVKPNGVITGYVIMYAPETPSGAGEWNALTVAGERTRARVDRLRPRTTYSFKLQARNSKGLGPFCAPVSYTTGVGIVMSAPKTVTVAGERTRARVERSRPRTTYSFKLQAKNSKGKGPFCAPASYTTGVDTGGGGGLAGATSAWLWASAGGACAVLALAAALALSLCCRRSPPPLSPHTSTYQKSSASAGIKPPDLWIHHDQMELKHLDKSLHSSASKISAGSVDGPSALASSTLTLPRPEYEPARHVPASLERRHVPVYVESRSPSCAGSDETAPLRSSPAIRCDRCDYRTMTGVGAGCAATCERRALRPPHPDQSTPLLAGMAPLGSPMSSLGSLPPHHTLPPPCGSGTCPLGASCAPPAPNPGGDIYACAARERGHYVAYEPLGHYTHRDSLSSEAGTGPVGPASAAGSLQRRPAAAPLHSFADSPHSTPSHGQGSVRETSPYKKSANSSPGHIPNRLQLGGSVPHCAEELEALTPSRSTERLAREMQNLEGLMKDLSAITQQQFHC